jgi:hypothetical protein
MNRTKSQASFELLITLALGLSILLPIVAYAFLQIANSSSSLASVEAQQAASKLSTVATLVGSEGPPSRQVVQVQIPPGVENIYVGTENNSIGHEIIFTVRSPNGLSYITSYTSVNVSGNIGGISLPGTYLINETSFNTCPFQVPVPCVYITPVT